MGVMPNSTGAQMTKHTPLPKLSGEYESLGGIDKARCRNVLRWLHDEGAISAIVALARKPHVACVHCSGFVSTSLDPVLHPLRETE